jgi:hypothetical protein
MRKSAVLYLIIFPVMTALSCCPEKTKDDVTGEMSPESIIPENPAGLMVADTIIYDVIIKNPNPDDDWTDKCLRNLKKEQFIDILFESVYKKQATAYDLFTDEIISPDKLKNLERKKEFSRSKIGKMQFTESWYYSDTLQVLSKKVISVSMGYEILDERGNLIGYKPAFKIYFN